MGPCVMSNLMTLFDHALQGRIVVIDIAVVVAIHEEC